jgi:imidazolonepropionase-like amidohydrolase
MKTHYLLIAFALSLLSSTDSIMANNQSIREANEVIIKNVTLISPERLRPLKSAHVRISDGIISEISTKPINTHLNTAVIDATGQFLIPGLMDSHVHISNMPGIKFNAGVPEKRLKDLQDSFSKQQPRSYLYFGVTQLLDPSQSQESIEIFNSATNKPDLFHCGAAPIVGGYPTLFAGDSNPLAIFRYLILDDTNKQAFSKAVDVKQHTPEAVVKRMANDGAICVKVFIEDGFGENNNWPLISNKLLKRVKAAANKHGLIMMAHANAIDMQEIAQMLDVDVIAHGMWNWNQFDRAKGLPEDIQNLLDKIIQQKIVFQPTFNVMDGLKGVTVTDILDAPLYDKVISKEAMKWYGTKDGLWFRDEMITGYGGLNLTAIHERQDSVISQGERVVEYLNQNNHPLVLASDTPSSPTFAAQPGFSTYQELQHLHKVGLSLLQVLQAATINNAKAFKIDNQYGTVEPGKVANLLLLNANPLESITAYNKIDKIIIHGQAIDRETLAVK